MSGGSAPSASTASEGEPEILLAEVPDQQEAIPGQEEDTEEDYEEVRAGRLEARRPEEGLSGIGAAHPVYLLETDV